jgi:hypothetical protein
MYELGTKVAETLDNPVDTVVLKCTQLLLPLARKTGHTANIITLYSFLFGILATVALYVGNPLLFVTCSLVSYAFDCMDGQFARTYNEVSAFGDALDHTTDTIVLLLILGIVGIKYRTHVKRPVVFYFIIMSLGCFFHVANQQWFYNRDKKNRVPTQEPELLDILIPIAEHTRSYRMHSLFRWFGPGTWWVFCLTPVVTYIMFQSSRETPKRETHLN